MRLDEVHGVIVTSDPLDWHRVEADNGSFLNTFVVESTLDAQGAEMFSGLEIDGHFGRAAYRPDVSLGIAWGLRYEGGRTWQEDWATYPDRTIRAYWADVFYAGMLVDRHLLLNVDGGRCFLPTPHLDYDTTDVSNPILIERYVDRVEHGLARLVDGLGGGVSEFDSYFDRSGIQLRDS